jgi:hypothetical protein
MPLFIKRKDNNQIIKVRKYILDNEGNENVWSNEWYGKHTIGIDCEWNDKLHIPNLLCGYFEPANINASATKCKCGREKWEH